MRHIVFSMLLFTSLQAAATTPAELLSGYTAQAGQPAILSQCPAQFQVWPAHWQQCRLLRTEQADLNPNDAGQIQLIWQVDPHTQGGEL